VFHHREDRSRARVLPATACAHQPVMFTPRNCGQLRTRARETTSSPCTRSAASSRTRPQSPRPALGGKPTRTAGAQRRGAEAARQPPSGDDASWGETATSAGVTAPTRPPARGGLGAPHRHRPCRRRVQVAWRSTAHVQRCWLALLLMRVVENATDDTWRNVREELDRRMSRVS